MERKEYRPEPNKLIDPAVLTVIVNWQIMEIVKRAERREFVDNMNA